MIDQKSYEPVIQKIARRDPRYIYGSPLWLSRFPAFSSWSSARKRVALATVSDSPGRCTRLCQRMPWRLRRLMAGIMQTHGATYTRYTPATCAWNAPIIREFRRMRNPSPSSPVRILCPAPIYPYPYIYPYFFFFFYLHRTRFLSFSSSSFFFYR